MFFDGNVLTLLAFYDATTRITGGRGTGPLRVVTGGSCWLAGWLLRKLGSETTPTAHQEAQSTAQHSTAQHSEAAAALSLVQSGGSPSVPSTRPISVSR